MSVVQSTYIYYLTISNPPSNQSPGEPYVLAAANTKLYVAGLAVYRAGKCRKQGKPPKFIRVSYYKDWIESTELALEGTPNAFLTTFVLFKPSRKTASKRTVVEAAELDQALLGKAVSGYTTKLRNEGASALMLQLGWGRFRTRGNKVCREACAVQFPQVGKYTLGMPKVLEGKGVWFCVWFVLYSYCVYV